MKQLFTKEWKEQAEAAENNNEKNELLERQKAFYEARLRRLRKKNSEVLAEIKQKLEELGYIENK